MAGTWGSKASWGNSSTQQVPAPSPAAEQEEDMVLGWDDTFTCEDTPEYILLDPGEYVFTVKSFERGYYNGSDDGKIKACPMAKLHLEVTTPKGIARVDDTIFLKMKSKWKIDAFFRCLGLAKAGQAYTPNWNGVAGMQGRAKIKSIERKGKKYNNIDRYVYPEK